MGTLEGIIPATVTPFDADERFVPAAYEALIERLYSAGPFLFLLGHTGSQAVLVTALLLFGAGRGFYDCNTMPVLCQIARDDLRSTGYGTAPRL